MGKVQLELYPERGKEVALRLKEVLEKEGIFGHRELPDDVLADLLEELSLEKALLVITLTTALDYMRSASELWDSSIKTLRDEEVSWVFEPRKVVAKEEEELLSALKKHGLAKKKHKDLEIWKRISLSLEASYGGSVLKLFEEYDYDVKRMFDDFLKNRKNDFPSLSGVKIFPHWIRSVKDKLNLPFKNLKELPIPVDVHIARATFTTGCIRGKYSSKGINETVRKRVMELWREALKDSDLAPIELFRPLWLLSKYGCHYRKNGERPKFNSCPVKEFCVEGKVVITSSKVEIDTL
ncbi:N-glycosylase/DNA lyase [Thermovibrio sp.]